MTKEFKTLNRFFEFLHVNIRVLPARITRTLSCSWCGKEFEWTGPSTGNQPHVCCKTHSTKAKRARQKRREGTVTLPQKPHLHLNPRLRHSTGTAKTCPRPEKFRHKSVEDALEAIKRVDPTFTSDTRRHTMTRLSPVEKTTQYATTVDTLQAAFEFVWDHMDELGGLPQIIISPLEIHSDDGIQDAFEVVVSNMNETK